MTRKKPGPEAASLIAFALAESLLRRLVAQKTLVPEEAADMIKDIIANVRHAKLPGADSAIPVLEEMLEEYRKQVR